MAMRDSWAAAGGLIVLAVIFVILAILYWAGILQVFTSTGSGPHVKHAILLGVLAILSLVAANFVRPKNAPDF
jgi:hypothetical protein